MNAVEYKCSKYVLTFCFLFLGFATVSGQGIRKHYTQFTEAERLAYEVALDQLIADGTLEFLAEIHADPDQDGLDGNNFNGPDTDSQIHRVVIFLSWHRQFTAEFERELQAINPKLTVPYWDWTGDLDPSGVNSRSAQSPLWDNDQLSALGWTNSLLGKYDASLNLNRELSGILPTSSQKQNLLTSAAFTSFSNFRFELEGVLHDPPHSWIGGRMQNMLYSPNDPAFFLHHATVDWLWQLWAEAGNTVSFAQTDMPTFDGFVPGFSAVDPNDIRNTVTQMGVFYADPETNSIQLRDHTVDNDHVASENFIYPDTIFVESSFQFANNAVAEIHSCESVVLKPGTSIPAGSQVTIGTSAFCSAPAAVASIAALPEEAELASPTITERVTLKGFPNPFEESFTFQFNLPQEEMVSMVLMDALGRVVVSPMPSQQRIAGQHEILVDANGLPSGIYSAVLRCHDSNQRYVLRVVKN